EAVARPNVDDIAVAEPDGSFVVLALKLLVVVLVTWVVHDTRHGPAADVAVNFFLRDGILVAGPNAAGAIGIACITPLGDRSVLCPKLPILRPIVQGVEGGSEVVSEAHRMPKLMGEHALAVLLSRPQEDFVPMIVDRLRIHGVRRGEQLRGFLREP